jgi:hypothetical protein
MIRYEDVGFWEGAVRARSGYWPLGQFAVGNRSASIHHHCYSSGDQAPVIVVCDWFGLGRTARLGTGTAKEECDNMKCRGRKSNIERSI